MWDSSLNPGNQSQPSQQALGRHLQEKPCCLKAVEEMWEMTVHPPLPDGFMIRLRCIDKNQYFLPRTSNRLIELHSVSSLGWSPAPNRCRLWFDRFGWAWVKARICLELRSLPDASVSTPLLSPEESPPANYDSNSVWEGHTDRGIIPSRTSGIDSAHVYILWRARWELSRGSEHCRPMFGLPEFMHSIKRRAAHSSGVLCQPA